MRVEQRIGRIDRLGQTFADKGITIVNLHYADTVETDVYVARRERIGLFSRYVGRLQPILSTLSGRIAAVTLSGKKDSDELIDRLQEETAQKDAFDIDEVTEADLEDIPLTPVLYDLDALDKLLQHPDLLPPGVEVTPLGAREYRFSMAGMTGAIRVTTDPGYYDRHSGSVELWSPGNLVFPCVIEDLSEPDINLLDGNLDDLLGTI